MKINIPYFSIITVVKNDIKNISSTIKSIREQSFKNFEYIIIDGKSSDGTTQQIRKHKKYIDLIISEKDKGIYFAMNKGAKLAKGKILVFVNSGDILNKDALKKVYKKFLENKKFDFIFGTVMRHYKTDSILKSGFNVNKLKYNFDFATSHSTGFFLKRKIFIKHGMFNTKYKISADYDLYIRLILKNKISGSSTNKNDLIGTVASGGYSSKVPFFQHLIEESKIRLNNNQNFFLILIIFFNAIFKFIYKKTFNKWV